MWVLIVDQEIILETVIVTATVIVQEAEITAVTVQDQEIQIATVQEVEIIIAVDNLYLLLEKVTSYQVTFILTYQWNSYQYL